jgi:lipoate-protein ligase A
VTALGKKLIGSAQVRLGDSVLQHGSIILDGDQDLLQRLRGEDEPVPPPATLRAVLGRVPPRDGLAASLEVGLAATLGGEWSHAQYEDHEKMAAEKLLSHYEDAEWTWRF